MNTIELDARKVPRGNAVFIEALFVETRVMPTSAADQTENNTDSAPRG